MPFVQRPEEKKGIGSDLDTNLSRFYQKMHEKKKSIARRSVIEHSVLVFFLTQGIERRERDGKDMNFLVCIFLSFTNILVSFRCLLVSCIKGIYTEKEFPVSLSVFLSLDVNWIAIYSVSLLRFLSLWLDPSFTVSSLFWSQRLRDTQPIFSRCLLS